MKRIISFALIFIFCLSLLGGCGEERKNDIVGEWQGEMDYTRAALAAMGLSGDSEVYFRDAHLSLVMTISFAADGTYTAKVDETCLKRASVDFIAAVEAGLLEYMKQEHGVEPDSAEAEAYLAELPTAAEFASSIAEGTAVSGKYRAEGGKLYMSADGGINENVYETYSIEGDTLTISGSSDPLMNESGMYPMVFKKQ